MAYKDGDVIKALCAFEAKGGIAVYHFVREKFPDISNEQLTRCLDEARELREKLKALGESDTPKKSGN